MGYRKSIWVSLTIVITVIMSGLIRIDAANEPSHVESKEYNNAYVAAITLPDNYQILDVPTNPSSFVDCTKEQDNPVQYKCDSRDNKIFFIQFTVYSAQPVNSSSSFRVYIFGDQCSQKQFCTDLAIDDSRSGKISLGPLGKWPTYVVIIAAVVLGLVILGVGYLVYRRNSTAPPSSLPTPRGRPKNTLLNIDGTDNSEFIPPSNNFDRAKSKKRTRDINTRSYDPSDSNSYDPSYNNNMKNKGRNSKNKPNDRNQTELDIYDVNYNTSDVQRKFSYNTRDSQQMLDLSHPVSLRTRDRLSDESRTKSGGGSRQSAQRSKGTPLFPPSSFPQSTSPPPYELHRSGKSRQVSDQYYDQQSIRDHHRTSDLSNPRENRESRESRSSPRKSTKSKKSRKKHDIESDTDSTNSSSNDNLPLAITVNNLQKGGYKQRRSRNSQYTYESGRNQYDSVLDEMLGTSDYQESQNSEKNSEKGSQKDREEEYSNEKPEIISDDEVPIGILRAQ
ncbi:3767_t:CDS:2 [Diversispora eburnea]|uniref:3767_t:CDS:1 n=1 Tax=Diversispora eburnea TaxID=1213867 RepID=A0A9N9FZD6_9GLOM|nr:3767_t:CDS:2 [Diversispora eburnea]